MSGVAGVPPMVVDDFCRSHGRSVCQDFRLRHRHREGGRNKCSFKPADYFAAGFGDPPVRIIQKVEETGLSFGMHPSRAGHVHAKAGRRAKHQLDRMPKHFANSDKFRYFYGIGACSKSLLVFL
jgi:hypothetical protein